MKTRKIFFRIVLEYWASVGCIGIGVGFWWGVEGYTLGGYELHRGYPLVEGTRQSSLFN